MKVVEGGFGKKQEKEKAKASDVLQAGADMMEDLERDGVEADVVVVLQMRDSPAIVMSNADSLDRTSTLLRFAQLDLDTALYMTEYSTQEEEEYDGPLH